MIRRLGIMFKVVAGEMGLQAGVAELEDRAGLASGTLEPALLDVRQIPFITPCGHCSAPVNAMAGGSTTNDASPRG
jgi:hypothetical protein